MLTGGLGFIGHHTVEHFLETTEHELVVIDSLRHAGRIDRLTDIDSYDPDRVSVFWHDLRVRIPDHLHQQFGGIDWIINMAADSHVDRSIEDPVPFVNNNVMLSLNALEYARDVGAKFIQISTDEVYGPAPAGVFHKETDPLKPSNPYSASKAAQEHIAYSYRRTYGVPLIVTRTMNNFGERQHPEKFIPGTIRRFMRGEEVIVHARDNGDGTWTPGSRVWLHARNHADALRFLIENVKPVPYGSGEVPVFNVAGEVEIDNGAVADLIAEVLGVEANLRFEDFHSSRPGHDLRYALDGSKLAEAGWKAPVSFEESFERTVRWYEKNPHWLSSQF